MSGLVTIRLMLGKYSVTDIGLIIFLYNLQCVHIIDKLHKLSIAKEEYFLLKALVLANSDVRLEDASALKKFRDSILSALCDCVYVIR